MADGPNRPNPRDLLVSAAGGSATLGFLWWLVELFLPVPAAGEEDPAVWLRNLLFGIALLAGNSLAAAGSWLQAKFWKWRRVQWAKGDLTRFEIELAKAQARHLTLSDPDAQKSHAEAIKHIEQTIASRAMTIAKGGAD